MYGILKVVNEKLIDQFKDYHSEALFIGIGKDALTKTKLVSGIVEKFETILNQEIENGSLFIVNASHNNAYHQRSNVIVSVLIISFDDIVDLKLTTEYGMGGIEKFTPSRKIHSIRKGVETKIVDENKLAISYRRGSRYSRGYEQHDSIFELGN